MKFYSGPPQRLLMFRLILCLELKKPAIGADLLKEYNLPLFTCESYFWTFKRLIV